jgi:GTPase KRas protein
LLFDEFEDTYGATVEDSYRHTFVVGYKEHLVDITDISGSDVYKTEYDRASCIFVIVFLQLHGMTVFQWFSWADAFVLVYSISEEDSFFNLRVFRDEIAKVKKRQEISLSQVPMILVGTKRNCAALQ